MRKNFLKAEECRVLMDFAGSPMTVHGFDALFPPLLSPLSPLRKDICCLSLGSLSAQLREASRYATYTFLWARSDLERKGLKAKLRKEGNKLSPFPRRRKAGVLRGDLIPDNSDSTSS
ncbi:hypothetical protein OIU79_020351 [Salix purpurea]|uniref:Uncharacterized protein n=1 Tax=Salix purpurea TaxID=77065 RepID=A0A9Q0NUB9_SALPP|nr:hypothetical protein OIU79_020351 [Salix purpurea]